MKRYKSNSELRNLAKEKLTGKFGSAILTLFATNWLKSTVSSFVTSVIPANSLFWNLMTIPIAALVSIFLGILQTGISFYFLKMACGQNYSAGDVFYGFHENRDKSLKISAVYVLADTLCLLPYQALLLLYLETNNMNLLWNALITLIAGYIVLIPIRLAISQCYFLLLDFPEATAKEIIFKSVRIMKKNMFRFFLLDISFIPLMILCCFSFGIGFLWLNPYMQMTHTVFFLDLMNPGAKSGSNPYNADPANTAV